MHSKIKTDVDRLYKIHVLQQKMTYHEFCRTVALSLGWPVQRVYPLLKQYFPERDSYGEDSIYESMHRYGY